MHISNADHMIGFKTKCSVIIVPPPLPTATLNFSLQGGEKTLLFGGGEEVDTNHSHQ